MKEQNNIQSQPRDSMHYESDIWVIADLLLAASVKQRDFPAYMMPFFALMMLEARMLNAMKLVEEEEGLTVKDNPVDGDFRYFKHIVDGMNLQSSKVALNIDTLKKNVKGIYGMSFVDWSDNGLSGKDLDEYNDIHHCAEVFFKILSDNRPKIVEEAIE